MTMAVAVRRLLEPLDLVLGQVLAGPQVPIWDHLRDHCSIYGVMPGA
jgi:hypothetical protein